MIVNECFRVHRGCVLNMLSERYLIYLVPIPLRGSKVVMGMDWLGPIRAMIDCEHQLVGENWLSAARMLSMDRQYVQV